MILILPLILGLGAAGAGALGIAKGSEGISNFNKAEEIGKAAEKLHKESVTNLEDQWQETNRLAGSYGNLQLRVRQRILGRFIEFIQRHGQKVSESEQQFLEGLECSSIHQQLPEFKALKLEADDLLKSIRDGAGVGLAAGAGAANLVGVIGKISIPQFFGLFTKQVAVAELGLPGVALWLGGGNVLVGGAVLGGVAIGPALAVGGFQLAGKAEKALTQAQEYQAKVNINIEKIKLAEDFLKKVELRIREIGILVRKLETYSSQCLDDLESQEFHPVRDAYKFQKVALSVTALVEISKTPILDNEGNLNPLGVTIKAKYDHLAKGI
jgi:hypothetical protein